VIDTIEDALDTKFLKGSKFAKIMRSNNEILSKSRYYQKTVSPQKISEGSIKPKVIRKNLHLKNFYKLDDTDALIKEIANSQSEVQPFLPFLNQKRRREALSTTKRYDDCNAMFQTNEKHGLTVGEKTDPTSVTVRDRVVFNPK
jgi:hypothetical protein